MMRKKVNMPHQIVTELHTVTRMYNLPWMLRFRQAAEVSLLITVLYRKGGYLAVFFISTLAVPRVWRFYL